jgi:hypothetical protein
VDRNGVAVTACSDEPDVKPNAPPQWLGNPVLLTKDQMIAADAWPNLEGLAPHAKRQASLAAVSKLRPDLFG